MGKIDYAQNLICIAKMAAVSFEPYDWLRQKQKRLDDATSVKIREFYMEYEKRRWRLCFVSPMIGQ